MAVRNGKAKQARSAQAGKPASSNGTTRKVERYGWVPDLPDQRDHTYAVPAHVVQKIPDVVDLRAHCPPVYDQGQLGSCTGNAIAGALQFDQIKQKMKSFVPSRLFIYYNEPRDRTLGRERRGSPDPRWHQDRGSSRRLPGNGVALRHHQVCRSSRRTRATRTRLKYKALQYQSVTQNLADMQGCLASGYPFVFGFTVYESFESAAVARTGKVPMPKSSEQVVGGHAVLAVGYNNDQSVFIVRNSWGDGWGAKGYFYMPYAYLVDDNLANDLWTIRLIA